VPSEAMGGTIFPWGSSRMALLLAGCRRAFSRRPSSG
jgi:hypothetical protein